MGNTRTIAERLIRSLGIYTVAFNVPEPGKRKIAWANQHGREYRFTDGSRAIILKEGRVAQWVASWAPDAGPLVQSKLVNVFPGCRS